MLDDLKEKVRSILDRANHPNTPKPEAEIAFAMAQKLILKHGLDEQLILNQDENKDEIVSDTYSFKGTYTMQRLCVGSAIAKANSVATYRTDGKERGERILVMYGTKSDIFATKTLIASAELIGARLAPKPHEIVEIHNKAVAERGGQYMWNSDRSAKRSFLINWWEGFESEIRKTLKKATDEFLKDTATEQSSDADKLALVLKNKHERADQEMRSKVKLVTARSSGHRRMNSGFNHGAKSGKSFNLGSTRIGGSSIGELGR